MKGDTVELGDNWTVNDTYLADQGIENSGYTAYQDDHGLTILVKQTENMNG